MAFKISLNGSNYTSESRRRAFEEALAHSDHHIAVNGENGKHEARPAEPAEPASSQPATQAAVAPEVVVSDYSRVFEGLERGLLHSYDHQSETLRVHQQYLSNQASYADIFAALMQEQGSLVTSENTAGSRAEVLLQVLQSLTRSVEQFHAHQAETLQVHGQFLKQQSDYAQAFVQLLQTQYGVALQGSDPGRSGLNGSNGNGHKGKGRRIAPVHGGNGTSPVGDPVSTSPVIQSASVPVAAAVVQPVEQTLGESVEGVPAPAMVAPVAVNAGVSVEVLGAALLDIVSEKTGYPAEMLELEMDMEADLGIDSIKRVEILGALQDQHPQLPEVETDALAELRTLAQILDYMSSVDEAGSRTESTAGALSSTESLEAVSDLAGASGSAETSAAPDLPDTASLTADLLAIVSDKTGYPAEMLELDMDMEADLGIDSIKRVEILGSLQDQHPELPEVDSEALAELRTLAQIVDYMKEGIADTEPGDSKKA